MSVDVRTEVLFLLKCAEDVDDEELLRVIEGVRHKDPNKIPYIQDALMKRNKGESIRVARLLLRTPPNQQSTVTRVQPPSQSLSPSEGPRNEGESNNKVNKTRTVLRQHQKRLRDDLYKELIKCLYEQGGYDPRTFNLSKTPDQIMTQSLSETVLKRAGRDSSDPVQYNMLVSYIRTFTRRLSKCGIRRKNGSVTPATTFYNEYMLVFGWADPFNLKEVTQQCQKEMADKTTSIAQSSNHIAFNRKVYMLGTRQEQTGMSEEITVYIIGRGRSMCAGGKSCRCDENLPVLVDEVHEDQFSEDHIIENTTLHDHIRSGNQCEQAPDHYRVNACIRWPRRLLVEKAFTVQDALEKQLEDIAHIDSLIEKRKKVTAEERLEQLRRWAQEKKMEASALVGGGPFVCPKPRNTNKGDIEGYLGSWINSKVYEAKNKKAETAQRMKAIDLLNGPVAEILGREQNWWCSLEKTERVKRIRAVENDENRRPKRIRPKKRVGTEVEEQCQLVVRKWMPSVRSSRAREVKPNSKYR